LNARFTFPLGQLRDRLGELRKDRPILVHCAVGLRAHIAVRILRQHGFDARNLSGAGPPGAM